MGKRPIIMILQRRFNVHPINLYVLASFFSFAVSAFINFGLWLCKFGWKFLFLSFWNANEEKGHGLNTFWWRMQNYNFSMFKTSLDVSKLGLWTTSCTIRNATAFWFGHVKNLTSPTWVLKIKNLTCKVSSWEMSNSLVLNCIY